MGDLDEKMAILERLCPGTKFEREIKDNVLRFLAPSTRGAIDPYRVDLSELGVTAEQWFDDEIARHQPSAHDSAYNVFCRTCGKVQIGQANYRHQMALANAPWICPKCGAFAEFDDETYEEYIRARQGV